MFKNKKNTIIYLGLVNEENLPVHYFDLFVNKIRGKEIITWLSDNNIKHWSIYEAINTTKKIPIDALFTSEHHKSFWYWLLMDNDDEAMLFRLTWEGTTVT